MAEVLFEIPEWLDYADYDNYPSESKPTTNADFINYSRNQNKLVGALTGALLWQPNTNFIAGKTIISPNMPEGMEAVALNGGRTANSEPKWARETTRHQDGGVEWELRFKNWGKTEGEARNVLNTNLKTYTTFEQLGFSSTATLLEVVNAMPKESQFIQYIGSNSYEAFGVPQPGIVTIVKAQGNNYANLWHQRYGGENIVRRAWFENWGTGQTNFSWKEIAFLDDGVLPVDKGGTGGNAFIKGMSIDGTTVTLYMADGTEQTLTTQDTNNGSDMIDYVVESYTNGTTWYKKYKSGWVEQGASVGYTNGANTWVPYTLPTPMADGKYSVVITDTIGSTGTPSYSAAGNYNNNTSTTVYLKAPGNNRQINYVVFGQGA